MTIIFNFILFFFISTLSYASPVCTAGSTYICSGACTGTVTTCPEFPDDTSCATQSGCGWNYDCTGFDEGSCISTASCSGGTYWSSCSGDSGCEVFGDETSCTAGDASYCDGGTYFSGCSGDEGCDAFGDETTCINGGSAGCMGGSYWVSCSGPDDCPSQPDQTSCEEYGGCTNDVVNCGDYADEASCNADLNCGWATGLSCTPDYIDCGGYGDESSCNGDANCSWAAVFLSCSNDYTDCSGYGDESSCSGDGNCSWGGNDCTANYGDCADYNGDQGACEGTSGCGWDDPNCSGSYFTGCTGFLYPPYCSGTPNAAFCSNYGTSGECNAIPGCSWADYTCPNDKCVIPMDF